MPENQLHECHGTSHPLRPEFRVQTSKSRDQCKLTFSINLLMLVALAHVTLSRASANAAELSWQARVIRYTPEDGQPVQAMMFKLHDSTSGIVAHTHFVFIDTSASQVGSYRQHALGVLESLLKALPETDRVRIYAIDVEAEPLMTAFAKPQGHEVDEALKALSARVPLGATNFQKVVRTAVTSNDAKPGCSIIYIGDGMSTADLLEDADLRLMISRLRDRKMPLHSYGVGPQINLQVLGTLAHQTGGYVDFDNRRDMGSNDASQLQCATERGAELGAAVQRSVFFPKNVGISPQTSVILPLLPLREDRETIHVVRGEVPVDAKVKFTSDVADHSLEWKLAPAMDDHDFAFLTTVASEMEKDHGLSNPLAGMKLVNIHQKQFAEASHDRVAQIDSTDSTRTELESHIDPGSNASLVLEQQQATRVKTEKLRNQVHNAVEDARHIDPESGIARLKQVDSSVRAAIDISPEDRLQLLKRLDAEMAQLRNLADIRAQERVQRAEQLALLEAQKLLTDQASLDESTLTGLIERVRGLMLEGRHGRDDAYGEAQVVSDVAINLRPGEKSSAAARFDAEAAQQLARSYRLRARRADQFLETLHQVELAHIPFPDEPPVRFPPAEIWTALTARRQKWKSVDLRSDHPREQRIQAELTAVSAANFTDIPLKDAIDVLKEQHQIEIQFDEKALSEEGISKEKEVTLILSGVTLRSLLKMLLEPLALTYVIEDEVMKITTATAADTKMTVRVYPVADLVTIMRSGGMMGGGMGGMGRGGMGGGGMMGGMGGGMGGMGGGMGMFSVPPESDATPFGDAASLNRRSSRPVNLLMLH